MSSIKFLPGFFGVILCLVISAAISARGQTVSPSPSPTPKASATPTLEQKFFKNILHDQKAIWTSPFHMHRRDARWAVPLGLGTAALITTDRLTGDEIAESHKLLNTTRVVSYAGSAYGVSGAPASYHLFGSPE